ncbi:MAG TPA: 2-amino-4-hydroxy-6-hydroxymethyldihydropteridine diphosphokinase [Terrimicrobiaceae bacterium]|nr:2-amino-4-hydroxy-6-hydroxymethyldihydropteridine diphosphokinase [Terrimicrobiaceae bacterium]
MRAGIALGSNIEPRLLNLQTARRRIFALHSGNVPVACSKVYETSPVDCAPGTSPFLNAVLEITSDLPPEILHQRLQAIERELGRPESHERNSPRTIDLDLLYCASLIHHSPTLTLPHPRIAQRQFVLMPLCDIRPTLILPNFTQNIEQLSRACSSAESLNVYCETIY